MDPRSTLNAAASVQAEATTPDSAHSPHPAVGTVATMRLAIRRAVTANPDASSGSYKGDAWMDPVQADATGAVDVWVPDGATGAVAITDGEGETLALVLVPSHDALLHGDVTIDAKYLAVGLAWRALPFSGREPLFTTAGIGWLWGMPELDDMAAALADQLREEPNAIAEPGEQLVDAWGSLHVAAIEEVRAWSDAAGYGDPWPAVAYATNAEGDTVIEGRFEPVSTAERDRVVVEAAFTNDTDVSVAMVNQAGRWTVVRRDGTLQGFVAPTTAQVPDPAAFAVDLAMLLGAIGHTGGGSDSGAAWVVLGPASGSVDLASADAILLGAASGDEAGVALAGTDIDGDSFSDVVVGAYFADGGDVDSGAGYLLYGPLSGTMDLGAADAVFAGESTQDYAGGAVAAGGDGDGDGYPDILVSAYGADTGASDGGCVYLLSGQP